MHFYILRSFLAIGSTSFGGSMSMVVSIRNKLVEEDKCVSDDSFAQGLALGSVLPGPLAVNMAAYCGYLIGGVRGATVALLSVLLPSFIMMTSLYYFLEWAMKQSEIQFLTFLVSGVAFALILSAGIDQTKKYCINKTSIVVCLTSLVVLLVFGGYLAILFLLLGWVLISQFFTVENFESLPAKVTEENGKISIFLILLLILIGLGFILSFWFFPAAIFSQFSKISLTTFGGAYVIVSLLKSVLVDQLEWISSSDLLIGISLGQLTPGPILICSVFLGQKIYGFWGSIVATAGTFIPTALLMLASNQYFALIRNSLFIRKAFGLIHPFIAGLMLYAACNIVLSSFKDYAFPWHFTWWVFTFVAIYFLKIKPIWLIGLSIALGVVFLIF